MYICEDCGKIVEEQPVEYECLRMSEEFSSYITTRSMPLECSCGGTFVKAETCIKCGDYTANSYCICESCLEDAKTVDNCLEIGEEWQDNVKLNGFLMTFFDKADIEHILIEHIKNSPNKAIQKAVDEYYNYDEDYFMGWVQKKWKKEK